MTRTPTPRSSSCPRSSPAGRTPCEGLDTRLKPGVLRPITFDPEAAEGRNDLVYVHLGHPIVQKAQRLLRRSLLSVDSPLNRVTAVVVDDLPESFVAAVSRLVLVGRGGLRLHEEVFLVGVRLRGRRAMAEEKAEAGARPGPRRRAASPSPADSVRDELCDIWNAPDAPLRARLRGVDAGPRRRGGTSWCWSSWRKRQAADIAAGPRDLRRVPREPA